MSNKPSTNSKRFQETSLTIVEGHGPLPTCWAMLRVSSLITQLNDAYCGVTWLRNLAFDTTGRPCLITTILHCRMPSNLSQLSVADAARLHRFSLAGLIVALEISLLSTMASQEQSLRPLAHSTLRHQRMLEMGLRYLAVGVCNSASGRDGKGSCSIHTIHH